MKYALVNPNWDFQGSIYFGCREPHLPIEYGYAQALLRQQGHQVMLLDGHMYRLTLEQIRNRVTLFQPDYCVVTTAPSYLFWRCPQPELRVPLLTVQALRDCGATIIAVGPHGSATPEAVLKKLGADMVAVGEFEDLLQHLAEPDSEVIRGSLRQKNGPRQGRAQPHLADVASLPPLRWPDWYLREHRHHHHRFDRAPEGLGAEMETSRGCPYRCLFCAKENFRGVYRRRPAEAVARELDTLLGQGVTYVYFIDELFLPDTGLLERFHEQPFSFGIQTRIDTWTKPQLEQLGAAGCVSLEAGIESISMTGRHAMNKHPLTSDEELLELLIVAKKHVPFVQANLILTGHDSPESVKLWRARLRVHGIWANDPVPVFPYPGSPLYRSLWGEPDEMAWERAHESYLRSWRRYSDIQHEHPQPLRDLETGAGT